MTIYDVAGRWGDKRADGKANTRAVAKAMRQWRASDGAAGLRYFVRPCSSKEAKKPYNWLTRMSWVLEFEQRQSRRSASSKSRVKPRRKPRAGSALTIEQIREQARAYKDQRAA